MSDEFLTWIAGTQVADAHGVPLKLFHGTSAPKAFNDFDARFSKTVLNREYQGDGFYFTESPQVASRYADSARNQELDKAITFAALDARMPPLATAVFKDVVNHGYAHAWNKTDEEIAAVLKESQDHGIDLNDLLDVAEWVEGSNYHRGRDAHALFDASMIFGGGARYIPDWLRDSTVKFGLADALPSPHVLPVYLRATNVLQTTDPRQARRAREDGYDGVHYSGEGTVEGMSEWIVFSPDQIKSAIGLPDPRLLMAQEAKTWLQNAVVNKENNHARALHP